MKLKLKNTPEQVELIKAMGSKSPLEAAQAMEAFAAFIGPVVQKVLSQAATNSLVYNDAPYDEDDSPSIPLDLYYADNVNHVSVWSQSMAGGLPSSQVSGLQELKVATYRLDAAVSFLKRYARRGRLDVVSKAVERMSQEILVKQERNAWAVILKALAEASTDGSDHVIAPDAANAFTVGDLSRLMTLVKRINASFASGTASDMDSKGLTDLFVSPEIMQEVRGFAYNPVNTIGTKATGPVALPNNVREEIFRNAGMSEIYGVVLHELNELGVGKKYNNLFDVFYGGSAPAFDAGTDEIVIGLDLSREAFIRPVAQQAESGGTFTALPDDQYMARQEKTGFYGFVEEGRVCLDSRAVVGLKV